MSRKAPPPKKRHTKPCKFFQIDRCPHPAEVCNFAHIIASPSSGGASIYRYYPAGYYSPNDLCRYSYGPKVPFLKPLDIPTSVDSHVPGMDIKNREKACLDRDTQLIPDISPIRNQPSSTLSPKTAAESPLLASSAPSPESMATGSTSTLDLDELVMVTDDPQYHEHLHSYQSQVYVDDDSPVIHVPPYSPFYQLTFNERHAPPYSYENPYMFGKLLDNPRTNTRSSTKQKILKYKTKPCRFFLTERGCPKGSSCTFIHNESLHQAPSPVKESSPKEENGRKNYFPVPWRIIGGGVRVGVKTDDSDQYSTVTSSPSVDPALKFDNGAPSTQVISRKRSTSNPSSPHFQQFKVEHLFSAESPGVL